MRSQGLHFELSFGMDDAASGDPASSAEPVLLRDAGPIAIRGRIDRVDRVEFEDRRGLLVVDYKTGRLPTQRQMIEGQNLQAPLYAAAAGKLLGEECLGGVFHRIGPAGAKTKQYFAAIREYGGQLKPDDDYPKRHQETLALVGQFVQAMRAGRFDVLPTHDCPMRCPFKRICHFSQARLQATRPQDGPGGAS